MTARGFARDAQAALIAERAGLQTARGVRRDLAALRDPAPVSVTGPTVIDADITGGHAMAQLLGVLHDAGVISDRTGFGQDTIPGQADSGVAPGSDDHTLIDGMTQIYRDEVNGWIPGLIALAQLNPSMLIAAIEGLAANGLIARTAAGVAAARLITAGASGNLSVTNGDGVAGNPTIDLIGSPSLSGLSVSGSATMQGLLRYGDPGSAPTITALTAAGTTATITGQAGGLWHGEFNLTPNGTGIAAGAVVRIAFGLTLANANYDVAIHRRNANASGVNWYGGTRGTTLAEINSNTVLTAGQVYALSYEIVGR